jgi:hypothetical protein
MRKIIHVDMLMRLKNLDKLGWVGAQYRFYMGLALETLGTSTSQEILTPCDVKIQRRSYNTRGLIL